MSNIFMRFPGGKSRALTLSYDDGVEQDIRLIGIMKQYGLKGTFNLNSGLYAPEGTVYPEGHIHRRMTKEQAIDLYKESGMEVAVHALTHPFLEQLSVNECTWEVIADRMNLEQEYDVIVRGMAYPFGTYSDQVVDVLEKDGMGLNLTHEVRNGILCHTGDPWPNTLEGQIVRRSDQIGYVSHDIDDAIRAGILTNEDIPKDIAKLLGNNHSTRINTLVTDAIDTSREAGCIMLSPEIEKALKDLRSFMFENVYRSPIAKAEESKAQDMLRRMFDYYIANPWALPEDFSPQLSFEGLERTVCDYIAGMTDNYAVDKFTQIFIPVGWNVRG